MQWLEIGKVASCGVHCQCTHPLMRWLHHILSPVSMKWTAEWTLHWKPRNWNIDNREDSSFLYIWKGFMVYLLQSIFCHHYFLNPNPAMLRQGTGLSVPFWKFAYHLFQHWLFVFILHRVRWYGAVCANQVPHQIPKCQLQEANWSIPPKHQPCIPPITVFADSHNPHTSMIHPILYR